MWRTRWRRARYRLLQHLPFSECNGLRAQARGRLQPWIARSSATVDGCDGLVPLLMLVAAGLGLLALVFRSGWLAAVAGLVMAGSLFLMAAELWIDVELEKVRAQAPPSANTPPASVNERRR